MNTTELINGKSVNIEWEQGELVEDHGSGCCYYALDGEDSEGNKYQATGNFQGDELEDVDDIEIL